MKVAVLLCGDLANLGTGLNLDELSSSLEASPDIAVEVVPDLCQHLAQFSQVTTRWGAARAVLGLCSGDYSAVELQARARKTGLDPFGLEVIPLGTLCARVHPQPEATMKAKVLLLAAVAKARTFTESRAEDAKPRFLFWEQKLSRRSLLTMSPIVYRPVPSVRAERCAAHSGCQLCVQACPQDALEKTSGHLSVDKTRCEGCGVCLAACPREAFDFPGWSLSQFEAQLAALLDTVVSGAESLGLLFTCQKAISQLEELAHQSIPYSHQWLPVVVPCLGMVTPTWVLQSLAHGAEVVALLFCGGDCPFGQEPTIGGRANFCRRLLPLLGQAPERVRVLSPSSPESLLQVLQEPPYQQGGDHPSRLKDRWHLGTLEGAVKAIQCLAGSVSEVILEHPYSPFGVLELRAEGCTGCLVCAAACPTGALASESSQNGLTLTFAASLCTGCGGCVDVCPESTAQVLRVRRMTNLEALSGSRVVLHKVQMAICENCGATIASQALLRRIEASLAGKSEALRLTLTRYCPSCRLSYTSSPRLATIEKGEEA